MTFWTDAIKVQRGFKVANVSSLSDTYYRDLKIIEEPD